MLLDEGLTIRTSAAQHAPDDLHTIAMQFVKTVSQLQSRASICYTSSGGSDLRMVCCCANSCNRALLPSQDVSPIPVDILPGKVHKEGPSRVIPFDQSAEYGERLSPVRKSCNAGVRIVSIKSFRATVNLCQSSSRSLQKRP